MPDAAQAAAAGEEVFHEHFMLLSKVSISRLFPQLSPNLDSLDFDPAALFRLVAGSEHEIEIMVKSTGRRATGHRVLPGARRSNRRYLNRDHCENLNF